MEQEGAHMAQDGMEHWRRAVRWTFVGIFAAALAGGLVGRMTAGDGAFDAADAAATGAAGQAGHDAATSATSSSSGSSSRSATSSSAKAAVDPQTAARGTAALL